MYRVLFVSCMEDTTDVEDVETVEKNGYTVRKEVASGHESTVEDTAVVLLSGGLDSTAALAKACEENDVVQPFNFTYGNLADDVESAQSHRLVEWARENVNCQVLPLYEPDLFPVIDGLVESPLTASGEDPSEYEDAPGYVPFRNMMFLSVAGSFATNNGYESVYIGASYEDIVKCDDEDVIGNPYGPRWDDFLMEAQALFDLACVNGVVSVVAPLIRDEMMYEDEVRYLYTRDWPLEYTYSCFEAGDPLDPVACGECSTCVERKEAFESVGVPDPLLE